MTEVDSAKPPPPPWGPIATAAWTLLAGLLSVLVSILALAIWSGGQLVPADDIMSNGPMLSVLTLVSTLVQIGVLALVARLAGWNGADYLGWIVPDGRFAVTALAAIMAFVLAYDVLTYLLGGDVVTSFPVDTYRSASEAGGIAMLWLTFVIAAPIGEEIVFRGFLFRGWTPTPRAVIPAIVVISAIWAIIHVQYDWFGILQIFLIGLILGWARWRSGSTMLT